MQNYIKKVTSPTNFTFLRKLHTKLIILTKTNTNDNNEPKIPELSFTFDIIVYGRINVLWNNANRF